MMVTPLELIVRDQEKDTCTDDNCAISTTSNAETSSLSDTSSERTEGSAGPTGPTLKKNVSFSTLEIREYPIVVGENPSVTKGCPVSLDWDYDFEHTLEVDDYEAHKSPNRPPEDLRMPSEMREEMLKSEGFSRKDIMEGTKQANVIKGRRRRTEEIKSWAPFQEFMEKAKRGTLNATIRRGAKQKERDLVKAHRSMSV